ncbi:hypothetical protein B0J14DRAFT_656452 [Halenospora varia]|nr:hypothetical protein B0J14DRAFT_656452 [Halenospora varia]
MKLSNTIVACSAFLITSAIAAPTPAAVNLVPKNVGSSVIPEDVENVARFFRRELTPTPENIDNVARFFRHESTPTPEGIDNVARFFRRNRMS